MASSINGNASLHLSYDFSRLPAEMLTTLFLEHVAFSDLPSVLSTCRVFYQIVHQDPRVQALGEQFRKICLQKEQDSDKLQLLQQMNSFSLYHQLTHEELTTYFPVIQTEWIKRAQSLKGEIHSQSFLAGHGKLTALIIEASTILFNILKRIPFQIEKEQRNAKIKPLEALALALAQPIVDINTQLTAVTLKLTQAHFENSCIGLKKTLQELVMLTQLLPHTSQEEIKQVAFYHSCVEALQWDLSADNNIAEMITYLKNAFDCRMELLKQQVLTHTKLTPTTTIVPIRKEAFTDFCTTFNQLQSSTYIDQFAYSELLTKMQNACTQVNPMITSLEAAAQRNESFARTRYKRLSVLYPKQVQDRINTIWAQFPVITSLWNFSLLERSALFAGRLIAVVVDPEGIQKRGTSITPTVKIWSHDNNSNMVVRVVLVDDATGKIVTGGIVKEKTHSKATLEPLKKGTITEYHIWLSETLETQKNYRLEIAINQASTETGSFFVTK